MVEVDLSYNNVTAFTGQRAFLHRSGLSALVFARSGDPTQTNHPGWIINGWPTTIETVNLEHNQLRGVSYNGAKLAAVDLTTHAPRVAAGLFGVTLKLTQIYLAHNQITQLPSEMFSFPCRRLLLSCLADHSLQTRFAR